MSPIKPEKKANSPVKVSAASMIGAAVESYDFFIYSTAASTWFGAIFFHTDDPLIGVMASFATLAVGFLMRPIGGYIGGHFGDRYGRKAVLFWSLLAMGIATILIGFLPTYQQVGIISPILLISLRMIQGIGYGAEWGGAVLMAIEHAPLKRRGLYGAIPQLGVPLGLLLANGSFLLSGSLFEGDWVWRAPFLFSVVMIAIGLFIRMSISESPDFVKARDKNELVKHPALEVIRKDWRVILKIIGLRLAETGGYYITTSFMLSYVVLASITDTRHILWGTLIGSALGLVSHLFYGNLSDKIGRRKVFLIGSLFTIAFGIPMFMMINTGAVLLIITAISLSLLLSHDPIFSVESSWFAEQFPPHVRSSGISLGYNGASVVAGLLPFIATALYGVYGWMGPAVIFSILGIISTIFALRTKETAPSQLTSKIIDTDKILKDPA